VSAIIAKTYIRTQPPIRRSRFAKVLRAMVGLALVPWYLMLAAMLGVPGLGFRLHFAGLGLKAMLSGDRRTFRQALGLIIDPMDSTRYFEFDYVSQVLGGKTLNTYLDVSSPRLMPIMLARKHRYLRVELMNPDRRDLETTRGLLVALGMADRCRTYDCRICDASFKPEAFDAITCISVLEHIPEDTEALSIMWSLLKPGGALVLTVPCKAVASEQYIDQNEYGVLEPEADGFVFLQRFYDASLLKDRILSVLGEPVNTRIYGEKIAGTFLYDADQKRRGLNQYWREPYKMAKDYDYFDSVEQLPGEGVIGMTFVKTGAVK
jgi:SAM-dependent methyltransferase